MKNRFYCFTTLLLCLSVASCVSERNGDGQKAIAGDDKTVSFVIGGSPTTKAPVSQVLDLSDLSGVNGLSLTETISDLAIDENAKLATKGTPIFTENLAQVYSALAVTAYDKSTQWGEKDVEYTNVPDSYVWFHQYPSGAEWPDSEELVFMFKAPVALTPATSPFTAGPTYAYSENVVDGKTLGYGTISFAYTSPGAGTDNSAELQDDILFSTKKLSREQNESTDSSVKNVLLYHALSAVKFKLGAGTDNLEITSIDKVTFNNIVSKGSCVIKPVYEGYTFPSNVDASTPKSSDVAIWTVDNSSKASFSQTYSADEQDFDFSDGDYSYPEAITGSAAHNVANLNNAKAEKTFMFVPQTVGDDVTLTVEFTYRVKAANDEWVTYPSNVTVIDFGKKISSKVWKAGELRTYTISINKTVDVTVDDSVDETAHAKSDLAITNTGTATAYMRVAVIGNWVYDPQPEDEGKIPAAITPLQELVSLGDAIRSDWFADDDGFYYYKHPVPGGHQILAEHTLFDEVAFTQEYSAKPYEKCHLEIGIAVQAVRADQVAEAWGQSVANNLDSNVQD